MYTQRQYTSSVRDPAGRYDGGATPSEDFPGAGVLRDLSDASTPDIPLILARYAALRAWSLGPHHAGDPVARHALSAAREHLAATAATAADWSEKVLLEQALDDPDGGRALRCLEAAADAAASLGHRHGAHALREAAHRARWRSSGFPPPSAC